MPLRRICIYCRRHLGDVGGEDDHGETAAICADCLPRVKKELEEFEKEQDLLRQIAERLAQAWNIKIEE